MKRIIALCLVAVLCLSLAACTQESKYADLEKMLDEGRYGEALTYILSLQAQNSSSAPLFGVVQPDDNIYSDEDLDTNKEPSAEVLALIDELMGEWVISEENEDTPQKFVFRADGTCTVDGTEMTWKREATSLSDDFYATFLSVWEGETERYRVKQPSKSDAGELSFAIGEVKGCVIAYGNYRYICSANYETIELTMDNWQTYFEWTEEQYCNTNAFGEITSMGTNYRFTLKEEYDARLSRYLTSSGAVEISYTIGGPYRAILSADGKSYTVGSFSDVYGGHPGGTETAICDFSSSNARSPLGVTYSWYDCYVWHRGGNPANETYCNAVDAHSVVRIQGTLYFVKAQ